MNNFTFSKYRIAVICVVAVFFSISSPQTAGAVNSGTLVKASQPAVYHYHSDGKRYVFPDEKTFFSWYGDFSGVVTITDQELAAMQIGGNVRYRPGYKMIKITSDPKVYAVGENGELRWVTSEQVAKDLYGVDWAKQVNDLSVGYFTGYKIGLPIYSSADFSKTYLLNKYQTLATLLGGTDQSGNTDNPPPQTPPDSSTATIYVAKTGNNGSGDGSSAKPFQTIAHALSIAEPHTTIAIGPGTYEEGEVRVREPHITLTSSGAQKAIIKTSATEGEDIAVRVDVDADGAIIKNIEIVGGFYGISMETKWDWGEADRSGVKDVTIENCIIHDTGRDAIKVKPNVDNVTIRNSEIYSTGLMQSPDDCNAEGIDNVNGDNLLVENNRIHNTCSNAIYCKGGATNCRVINNQIWDSGSGGILIGFDTSPEYFDLTVNPGYYENIGGVVRGNLVRNSGGAGIGLFSSKNALVENNTVINAGKNYHAPLYYGVIFQDWEPEAGRPANINPTIRNNIFVQEAGWPTLMSQIRYADELGGLSGLQGNANLSGNCYYSAAGAGEYSDRRPTSEFEGAFATWISHMGETQSVETNPGLNSNYRPTNQACIGKGY
ncbi:MAG: right-handed parallel beta-helix repeat-containing protein [Patescibacteria group bacterium]|nr:right-handed parallel beta-helix repeat-containing protein [Patescibacteria group bacterium]